MPRVALYAGSFDPVTNGHLDVVRQAAQLADRLVVAVGVNSNKVSLFSLEERIAMLEEACGPLIHGSGCDLKIIAFADLKRDEVSLNRFWIERSRCRGERGEVA
jgi:pantetheine-phosphate adenylyltransferase